MVSLYDLTTEFAEAYERFENAETDFEREEAEKAMALINQDKNTKYANCCAYYKNLQIDLDSIVGVIYELRKKEERAKKRLESFKNYMQMCTVPGEKWSNSIHSIGWRKSVSVEVPDEDLVPAQYQREKVSYTVNKELIKQDIESGAELSFASLVTKQNLQIR